MLNLLIGLFAISTACPPTMPLTNSQIGPISFVSQTKDLKAKYKYTREQYASDGDDYFDYSFMVCNDARVTAFTSVDSEAIWSIATASSRFMTTEGAHVGMTVSQLKRIFPNGKINIGVGEGTYANFSTTSGIYFDIDQSHIPQTCFETMQDCSKIVQNTKTISVFIRNDF